jgi:hypothetical protein
MGGEYLPPLEERETEIARISLASVTADQISVRARHVREGIIYSIVDEYATGYLQSYCVNDHRNQSRCDHVKLSRAGWGFRGSV